MAFNLSAGNPLSTEYDFHQIGRLGPHRVLIVSEANTSNAHEAGSLTADNIPVVYHANFDAGRTGTPALDLTISHRNDEIPSNIVVTHTVLSFEPGVAAGGGVGKEQVYNLHAFNFRRLGSAGGAAHMYDKDPSSVKALPIAVKKRTFKFQARLFAHLEKDAPSLATMLQRLQAGSRAHVLLNRLTASGTDKTLTFYCTLPADIVDAFATSVLKPLEKAVELRVPPYHQYTIPANVLNLNLDRLPQFRRHMYCRRGGATTRDQVLIRPPFLQLAPTTGRMKPRALALVTAVGLIREEQSNEEFCYRLAQQPSELRLIKTHGPVLAEGIRLFNAGTVPEPVGKHAYMALINTRQEHLRSMAPRVGSLFTILWCRVGNDGNVLGGTTGEFAYGRVVEASMGDLRTGKADFILNLVIPKAPTKERAVADPSVATRELVTLVAGSNRQAAQRALDALKVFETPQSLVNASIASLHSKVLHQTRAAEPEITSILSGPIVPRETAAQILLANKFQNCITRLTATASMANLTANESRLLNHVPSNIDRRSQLVRVSIDNPRFRCISKLLLAAKLVSHRCIVIVPEATDRTRVACLIDQARQEAVRAFPVAESNIFRNMRVLAYTTTDIAFDSPAPEASVEVLRELNAGPLTNVSNPVRLNLDMCFKTILDDLPDHSCLLDFLGTNQNAPANAAPTDPILQSLSMGDAIQRHFLANPPPPPPRRPQPRVIAPHNARTRHFANRVYTIDNGGNYHLLAGALEHRRSIVNTILSGTDILVTNYETAMSEAVKNAFPTPLLFLVGTDRIGFEDGAGVFMNHVDHVGAFILGDPKDGRHGPRKFMSEGWNEALDTFRRSLWAIMVQNGERFVDLA